MNLEDFLKESESDNLQEETKSLTLDQWEFAINTIVETLQKSNFMNKNGFEVKKKGNSEWIFRANGVPIANFAAGKSEPLALNTQLEGLL